MAELINPDSLTLNCSFVRFSAAAPPVQQVGIISVRDITYFWTSSGMHILPSQHHGIMRSYRVPTFGFCLSVRATQHHHNLHHQSFHITFYKSDSGNTKVLITCKIFFQEIRTKRSIIKS